MTGRNWQDMPDWLVFDVRAHHARAVKAGVNGAGEDAVESLTGKILREDPEFARALVTRYVRSLVRARKPQRGKKDPARDRLMAECAALAAEGLSLRAIGERKGISRQTAANLIAERQMTPEKFPAVNAKRQTGDPDLTLPVDSGLNVIPLRRPA
jgi:hypothetical protein